MTKADRFQISFELPVEHRSKWKQLRSALLERDSTITAWLIQRIEAELGDGQQAEDVEPATPVIHPPETADQRMARVSAAAKKSNEEGSWQSPYSKTAQIAGTTRKK